MTLSIEVGVKPLHYRSQKKVNHIYLNNIEPSFYIYVVLPRRNKKILQLHMQACQ